MRYKCNFEVKKKIVLTLLLLILNYLFLGYNIAAKDNFKYDLYSFYSINEIHLAGHPEIGLNEGDKFIYELIEKEGAIKEYLPELHALINATYWMVALNYTRNMDDMDISGYGKIVPIEEYFDTEYIEYWVPFHWETIRISEILEDEGYPALEGIAEWNYYENGGSNIDFGLTSINKLLDGTIYGALTLPGLVGDAQSGKGVLEFLELYNKALTDSDLRTQMASGYSTTWAKLGVLINYYKEYFVPEAIPELEPYAEEYVASELEYVDVLDNFFEGDEVKGEYACSEIMSIEENQEGWTVEIDKWDFTSNIEDFNNIPADDTLTLEVYDDAQNLGDDITVASICLQKQDVIPIIVNNYLNNIHWNDDVKIVGNTAFEQIYSGSIDVEGYTFDEINLSCSIKYDDNGMMKSTSLYGDVEVTSHYSIRIPFYELLLFHDQGGANSGENNEERNDLIVINSLTIILSSISIIFTFAFMLIIKKPRGNRR